MPLRGVRGGVTELEEASGDTHGAVQCCTGGGGGFQACGKGNERVPVAGFSRVGAFARRRSSSTYFDKRVFAGTCSRGVARVFRIIRAECHLSVFSFVSLGSFPRGGAKERRGTTR